MLRFVLLSLVAFYNLQHSNSFSYQATKTRFHPRIHGQRSHLLRYSAENNQFPRSHKQSRIILRDSSNDDVNVNQNSNSDDDPILTAQNDSPTADSVSHDLDTSTESSSKVPTYRTLFIFMSTTMLIWLSEPLLSLVDTTVVGLTQHNAVVQLASLGPATTLFDSLLYLTYFLGIATTNLISKGVAMQDYRQLQRTTSHVLGVATVLGILTMIFVFVAGQPVLKTMAGASGTQELLFFAFRYTWIRALASVSSVVGMVAQSFCLATLDTKTPAYAVAAASTVNLVGDLALAHWGVQGAAVATATSSFASTFILMKAVRKKVQFWRQQEILSGSVNGANGDVQKEPSASLEQQSDATEYEVAQVETIDQNMENDIIATNATDIPNQIPPESHKEIPLLSLPDSKSFIDLVKLSGPIFFVILAKIACYSAMTLRCTDFGIVALASHSIMMRIFFFYGCFGDSVSQTAQSFLPATLYPKPVQKDFREILKRLLLLAFGIGVLNSQVSIWILRSMGGYLTKDLRIITMMKDHAHWLGAALFLHPLILLFEGTVIASRDFGTLVTTYVATLGLHFAILKFFCGSFAAAWRCFFLFQSIRLLNFGWRVWLKQRTTNRKKIALANPASSGRGSFYRS